jgi:hypothetical protein
MHNLMNPGTLFIVLGLVLLFFGCGTATNSKLDLPRSAAGWAPKLCAAAIIVLIGLTIYRAASR